MLEGKFTIEDLETDGWTFMNNYGSRLIIYKKEHERLMIEPSGDYAIEDNHHYRVYLRYKV